MPMTKVLRPVYLNKETDARVRRVALRRGMTPETLIAKLVRDGLRSSQGEEDRPTAQAAAE